MKKIIIPAYVVFLLIFTLFSYLFTDQNLSYLGELFTGFSTLHRKVTALIYVSLILIFFIFYFQFLRMYLRNKLNKRDVRWIIAITSLVLVFSYPAMLSYDIFNYIFSAKILFFYHENPYIIMPIEFLNDPYLTFTRAANKTFLYGPFWVLLSGIPHFVGLGNFVLTLFSFKAFITLFYLGTAYLIEKLDKNAVLFFALNPLVIIEILVSSHNDIVMIFFAFLSFYLFFQKRYLTSFLTIVASTLIKFATIFLVPVYITMIKDKIFGKNISKEKAFLNSALFMLLIFFLSPFREELYPWYATWFIVFTAFIYKNKFLQNLILVFSLGLMLRYVPYMVTGNYFGSTPIIRNLLMVAPIVVFLIFSWSRELLQRSKMRIW